MPNLHLQSQERILIFNRISSPEGRSIVAYSDDEANAAATSLLKDPDVIHSSIMLRESREIPVDLEPPRMQAPRVAIGKSAVAKSERERAKSERLTKVIPKAKSPSGKWKHHRDAAVAPDVKLSKPSKPAATAASDADPPCSHCGKASCCGCGSSGGH